jgi:hypothetical protein
MWRHQRGNPSTWSTPPDNCSATMSLKNGEVQNEAPSAASKLDDVIA